MGPKMLIGIQRTNGTRSPGHPKVVQRRPKARGSNWVSHLSLDRGWRGGLLGCAWGEFGVSSLGLGFQSCDFLLGCGNVL